jgi:drug/metabolite transporter (DMT)-like permease
VSTAAAAPKEDIRLGILNMLLSVALFALLNVLVKWLAPRFPPVELAFFRQLFALVPIGLMLWHAGGGLALLRTRRPFGHATRALVGSCSMVLVFYAFELLPLADATALSFAQPLFLTALAGPLLGEKVRLHRWSAVIIGFIGVVIMAKPASLLSGTGSKLGVAVALGSALSSALAMATVRQLSRSEPSLTIIFYFSAIGSVLLGLALPFNFVLPTWEEAPLLLALGLVGGTAQFFLTQSYRFAPASALSPFTYSAIVWSTALGWAIWHEVPSMATMAGVTIVIASGLYIVWRETYRRVVVVKAGPVSPAAGAND